MDLPIATSTLTDWLSANFSFVLTEFLAFMQVILPYLVVIAVVFLFWRIGKSFFH